MAKLFTEFNDAKWEQVRTHPYYAPAVERIRAKAEEQLATDPPRVKFSEIHLFATTGDRKIFEKVFNDYSSRQNNFFFMYCLTGEQKYLDALVDIMWNICDFESWSIPAHVKEELPADKRRENLDLTSSVMGFRLAEILHFIGDKLPDVVRRRVEWEVRVRVIDSYKKNDYGWMRSKYNWSAVCIGTILAAYLYIGTKEELDEQLPRMLETMRCYLSGFDEEGCCLEGYGYWNYGFSHFCLFASLLYEYTDGEIDLFDDPKVRAIAHYQENIAVTETECISFSDSRRTFNPSDWLTHFLKKRYPDIAVPSFSECTSSSGVLRYILWSDPELAEGNMNPKSFMFSSNQWYIYRSDAYTLVCKGGYNAEPHNHNDVGSFMVAKNGHVTFTDPGGGEYSRQYFSTERYTILEPSSRSHSVPIINGEYQVTGKEKSEVYCAEEGHYAYSIHNAYAIPTLTSLRREFICEADGIRMTDTYDFTETPESVVERFSSLIQPEITPEGVRCGDSLLVFDPAVVDVELSSEMRINTVTGPTPIYFTDLKIKNPQKQMEITVVIR